MHRTKIFAAYLPQFHETEENNRFWGPGFTDWMAVKNSLPQFDGHYQPRIPQGNNYYDLSDPSILSWQAKLAREHGVDGFNIYHYWFKNGHKVLHTPAENLLENKDIDIQYFFSWDNTSWVRSWSNVIGNSWAPAYDPNKKDASPFLLELDYGGVKDWDEHFYYLLPFFQDERYLKIKNKPVFSFMKGRTSSQLMAMIDRWHFLSRKHGFDGLVFISGKPVFGNSIIPGAQFIYQPVYSAWGVRSAIEARLRKYLHVERNNTNPVYVYDYEYVWKKILRHAKRNIMNNLILGGVVNYDDTPRRGKNAYILINDSPEIFERYFSEIYSLCCKNDKEILLLTAWNEWGEGAYLEPDEKNGMAYLDALKRAVARSRQE